MKLNSDNSNSYSVANADFQDTNQLATLAPPPFQLKETREKEQSPDENATSSKSQATGNSRFR